MISHKTASWILLGVSACAIAVATLTPGGSFATSAFCILCGSRGLADFISNVMLFAPFGFALGLLNARVWTAVVAGVCFSLSVEVAQVTLISGRDANVGDLVANSCGALMGWLLVRTRGWWLSSERAMTRSLVLITLTLVALASGLYLLAPSWPESTYYLQWTARFGTMQPYEGRVLSTRIGPLKLPGPWRIEAGDSVRHLLKSGAPIVIEAVAAPAPNGLAPIVSIYDDAKRRILLIGADGTDLVYRFRARADDLKLDRGELRIADALKGVKAGSRLRLALRWNRKGYCAEVNDVARCGAGFTAANTWMLLISPALRGAVHGAVGILWLFCLFLPSGFVAGRKRRVWALAGISALVLLIAPLAIGMAPTPFVQVLAACSGLLAGASLRGVHARRGGGQRVVATDRDETAHRQSELSNRIPVV